MSTNKPTKKRQTYNTGIINVLSEEFEVTARFVRMCINNEKHSRTAENIRKKYFELSKPLEDAIRTFKNQ